MLTLIWAGVAAYIVFAAITSHARRVEQIVTSLAIDVTDSSSQGQLVSSPQVREWLRRSGIRTLGVPAMTVDLQSIEALIARNGFVDRVNAYVTYDGVLHVDISQRRPVVRLLTDGVDSYITADGYVFPAPRSSSLYVPVVTGPYKPLFPADYAGSIRSYIDGRKQEVEAQKSRIEKEKYPFYRRERENDDNIRALRRMRIKSGWFESDEAFELRVGQLRKKKDDLRRRYRYEDRLIQEGIAHVAQKQEAEQYKQKKLEKNYEDFSKLITFVKFIEDDDFWRSEVVQIIAYTSTSGALEVELIPRSGNYTILFGRIESVDSKFDKLFRFYRGGLGNMGWDKYRTIDVRYKEQVVCKK